MLAIVLAFFAGAGAVPRRPPILGVAHIEFRSANPGQERRFYEDLLGFPRVQHGATAQFLINPKQSVEIVSEPTPKGADRLVNVAFETTDARALRDYLAARGIAVPGQISEEPDGSLGFAVRDPENHTVEFVQLLNPRERAHADWNRRISCHLLHVGILVQNRAAEDRFYRGILGFREIWHGGMKPGETDWVDMEVPDGSDWVEYMLHVKRPDAQTLGVMHHFALAERNVRASNAELVKRGLSVAPRALPRTGAPQIGRDGKWQANAYDADGTRVELMNPVPSRTPCCAPFTGRSARHPPLCPGQ
ncbi:MAG TPA: VOC family protein [Terriglobales bacterium]|nr:VOC family protein [Terriglobales bacterium]